MHKIDYIIVGGGLAGICLAHHLYERQKSFHLYYDDTNSSSRTAAGLYNPITGRKMVKTWMADRLFPYLEGFYGKAEKRTDRSFLHQQPIYRPFFSVEEQNDWAGKSSHPSFLPFIEDVYTMPQFTGKFKDPYGGLLLKNSGWVDTSMFIDASLEFFKHQRPVIQVYNEQFKPGELQLKNGVVYQEVEARNLIFCDGVGLKNNPYFSWLPLRPLKGEIIDVRFPFSTETIVNRGVFFLPLCGNLFRVGSTYDHHDTSRNVTEKGKQQLTEKIHAITDAKFEIINHTAGIRPATKDRRPLLGRHPEHKNMLVFNGLGTKGVSLAPYFAHQLVDYMENNKDLDEEVNIQRFFSLYCT